MILMTVERGPRARKYFLILRIRDYSSKILRGGKESTVKRKKIKTDTREREREALIEIVERVDIGD